MIYYIIKYNIIYSDILHNIIKFCNKFEIDFNTQSIKNKKQLMIYYSILQLLIELKNNNLDKPIIIFEKIIKDSTIESCLNKISKILIIPIYYCEKYDNSEGMNKEISMKADIFYEKNTFNSKKLKKLLMGNNFNALSEKITNFKLLVNRQ